MSTLPSHTLDDDTKECPYCAEIIRKKAIKCRYCNEFLNDAGSVPVEQSVQQAPPKVTPQQSPPLTPRPEVKTPSLETRAQEAPLISKPPLSRPATPRYDVSTLGMEFVWINPGTFLMGSPRDEFGRVSNERQHEVTLTRGFFMQTLPMTQAQWNALMKNNPSRFKGDDLPIECESFEDAQSFIATLNACGQGIFRLATEAEWEYAARAGSTSSYCFGDEVEKLGEYAWYAENSLEETHPVGEKKMNDWGLYDMHGNVWEWVNDWYDLYPNHAVTDPLGPPTGKARVMRGGSFLYEAKYCRSAHRSGDAPHVKDRYIGFRLVREP